MFNPNITNRLFIMIIDQYIIMSSVVMVGDLEIFARTMRTSSPSSPSSPSSENDNWRASLRLEEEVTSVYFFVPGAFRLYDVDNDGYITRWIRFTLHYEVDNPEDERCLLGNTDKSKLSNGMMITHISKAQPDGF